MKNKNIITTIIVSVITALITGILTTYATSYLFNSNEVSYNNNSSGIASDNVQGAIDKLYEEATNYSDMRKLIYPVGSIYISVTDDTVAKVEARYGGEWESFGTGKTLVGVDTSNTNFNTVEKPGGSLTHNHGLNAGYAKFDASVSGWMAFKYKSVGAWTQNWKRSFSSTQQTATTDTDAVELGGTTDHGSSLQPYITVYMYKRTA